MKIISELLRNDYSFEQAESLQRKYRSLIMDGQFSSKDSINIEDISYIAGVDVSYFEKNHIEYGIGCAVLWNLKAEKTEHYSFIEDTIKLPYKPGFLGFRECNLMARAVFGLPNKPDIILCDGHGKIHPYRFGEAVQLGVALDISTIGVAKNPFIGYSKWKEIKKIRGNKTPIWEKEPELEIKKASELLGYAICLNDGSKPVFVSEGHNISLDTALKICIRTSKVHKQPEPIYLADKLSREKINKKKK